jgi:DNA-binding NtrC family response regulator
VLASVVQPTLGDELSQFLEVIRIEVPPLRRRAEDIPLLAERFIHDSAKEYARQPKRLASDALEVLTAWNWPGNVRELRNLMERLVLFVDAEQIRAADLPTPMAEDRAFHDLYSRFDSLDAGILEFERYHLVRALEESGGDDANAAARLGLELAEFRTRLKRADGTVP